MSSRREGDFTDFELQQQEEVHDVAHDIDGKADCICCDVGRAIPKAEGNVSALGLAAIRKSHKCAASTDLIA